jgi:PAS domain-containing protein
MVKQEALQAVENGRRLIDEARRQNEQAAQERAVEEKAKIAEQWQPHLQAILENVPEWAHSYAEVPDQKPDVYTDATWTRPPVVFTIPEVGKVYAYDFSHNTGVRFIPVEWRVDDDEERFFVAPATRAYRHQYEEPGYRTFNVALAYAHEFFQQVPDLQRQADERNAPKITSLNDWGVGEWTKEAISSWENGEGQQSIAAALLALVELHRQRF